MKQSTGLDIVSVLGASVFEKIRYRLLLSYLVVFASILGIFAIAVRVVFTRSLNQQLIQTLTTLAQDAAASAEFDEDQVKIGEDFSSKDLIARHQALQWFTHQGDLIAQKGNAILKLPFSASKRVQLQTKQSRIEGVILPIFNNKNRQLIGYVRASQYLDEFDNLLNKLDWGLGSGIAIALILSGISGIFLTRQAMEPIEDSFQRLKQFTADASHELRTPLMAIKSNAAVALKYPEGMRSTDGEKFQSIANATSQMTRLTEDLLLLARTDKITKQNWDTINLTSILSNLILLYKPQIDTKKIHFNCQLNEPLYVLGDSVYLTRLFNNFINNAINYTEEQGIIEIQTSTKDSYHYVSVKDTGIGIAPENIERVFDRFWRENQARSYSKDGSGLGLAIAKTIAQNHGGKITIISQVGVGSCFTVSLPRCDSLTKH